MNIFIVTCLFATFSREVCGQIFGRSLPPEPGYASDTTWIYWLNQTLDHFGTGTPTYWSQRYYANDAAWDNTSATSPVFLMVSGEDEASTGWMTSGAWVEWAYKYGALLLQLEHRFYGQSRPTEDTSVENLKYLTSEQAIADVSNFITQINDIYGFNSSNKWILFGGSYPGNLVAWSRLKLPTQVYGSISSSAPLQATVDFYQYQDVVRASLDTFSPGCSSQLTAAIRKIQDMMSSSSGVQDITYKFDVCDSFNATNPNDVKLFYQSLISPIASAVQYNNLGTPAQKIDFVCSYLNNNNIPDPVDRLADLINATSGQFCLSDGYQDSITYFQNTSWYSSANNNGSRPWLYQTCNEFGFYQTSESESSLLLDTLPIQFFTKQCTDIFGSNFNADQLYEAANNTNKNNGGTDIKVDRVVFVQGSIDPWHAVGMLQNPTEESPFIFINGTAHCQDMMSTNSTTDSAELTNARKEIEKYLDKWLQYNKTNSSG